MLLVQLYERWINKVRCCCLVPARCTANGPAAGLSCSLAHLDCQLPGRRHDKRVDGRRAAVAVQQTLEKGQAEGGRLSGPCMRAAYP